jgi:hypothetical protein
MEEVGSKDIRVSPNLAVLTQPFLGYWAANFGGTTGTKPLDSPTVGVDSETYQLVVLINPTSGDLQFAPGIYSVGYVILSSGTGLSVTISAGTGSIIALSQIQTSGTHYAGLLLIEATTSISVAWTFSGSGTTTGSIVTVASTLSTAFSSIPEDNGMWEKGRPVAMTLLAKYTGTTLEDGGKIAACLVKGDTLNSAVVTPNPNAQIGQLQDYESIMPLANAFNGALRTGAYVWWRPMGLEDMLLRTPSDMNSHDFPFIVCAGQFIPNNGGTSTQAPVHFRFRWVFEFQSNVRLLEQCQLMGTSAIMDDVNNYLSVLPTAMENPAHPNFIQKAMAGLKKGAQWLYENRATLGAAAKTLAPLLV